MFYFSRNSTPIFDSELERTVEDIKRIMLKLSGIAFELLSDLLVSLKHSFNNSLRKAFEMCGIQEIHVFSRHYESSVD